MTSRKPNRPAPTARPAPKRKAGHSRWGRLAARGAALTAIWGAVAALFLLIFFAWDLPDVRQVTQAERRPSIAMLAADGTQFARYGDMHGKLVQVGELPPHLIEAVIATEDRRFYYHFGIDPIGLARAAWTNWRAGQVLQGGSTITQQLAKNLFLSPDRTLKRKVQEAMLAVWLEATYSKDEILGAYLNRVYLGSGTYGVEAAAQTYFGKSATEVNLQEAAIIAGLLKAPSRFSPAANPHLARERAGVVLAAMLDAGYVSEAEVEAIRNAPPTPRRKPGGDGWRYFADHVAEQVRGILGPEHGDVQVQTTLDPGVQRAAERRLTAMLSGPAAQAKASQAAVVVLGLDGAVRAMVGGGDYDESQFNRATVALRQPGSSFKPFLFLAAVEAGMTADTMVDASPVRIGTWRPENFEPGYNGTMTLRDALAHSVNTAAVRLIDQVGVDRMRDTARRMGIEHPLGRDLSLALGTSEVSLLELSGAYAAFANGGRAAPPFALTEIRDGAGRVLYRRTAGPATVAADPGAVGEVTRMMMAVLEYGTGKAARLDRMAAGKTGTSQDHRDAWFVGFTGDMVAGVWLGNDDNAPMRRVTGGGLPARLWREVMTDAHQGRPPRPLPGLDSAPMVVQVQERVAPVVDGFQSFIERLIGGGSARAPAARPAPAPREDPNQIMPYR
ncbi:transglycosylase domain-containing protein [Arenibaculum pallidiluteum]|uniref:transglycosylase domain-containing protein n=1 Tax=Arenibaculum pallidiluteum TaxID=2812559 RepID=UPI002E2E10DE|nr:PBP1A family penicillin-binding protein [Arenibaculum pallidiluteum]